MQLITKLFFTAALIGLAACGDDEKKEDVTQAVNKAGAVETSVTVQHADSAHDVLLTTHKVWVNFKEYKTLEYRDTIPVLGIENATAENSEGDKKNVAVKKDYEIFITVK